MPMSTTKEDILSSSNKMAIAWMMMASMIVQFVYLPKCTGAIFNVALNKPATMSSKYKILQSSFNYSAAKATDGNTTVGRSSIIHTDINKKFAWWMVDLQTKVQNATVNIYFRTEIKRRRNGIELYRSESPFSSYPGDWLCYKIRGRPDGSDIPDVFSVTCPGTWQYFMVYTKEGNGGEIVLDFGEVEVLICSNGSYGENCGKSCISRFCAVTPTSCDRYTGECPSGECKSGWTGTDCTKECKPGSYGVNCVNSCSSRHCRTPSSSCDRETGRCPDGCLDRWTGDDCGRQCPTDTFGTSCLSCSTRHCKGESDCSGDGTCSGGCQDGWTLDNCTQECKLGTYGQNCVKHCDDRRCKTPTSSCNPQTGRCTDGCQDGWTENDCTRSCPSGIYGPGCGTTCGNCDANICNHVTGNCPGDCKAGWRGKLCKLTCLNETYGINCEENCGQCNGTCDVVDGRCLEGCLDGYYGVWCHEMLQTPADDPDAESKVMTYLIFGVTGAAMVSVIIGIYLCRLGLRRLLKTNSSEEIDQSVEMQNFSSRPVIRHGVSDQPQSTRSQVHSNYYDRLEFEAVKDYDVIAFDNAKQE